MDKVELESFEVQLTSLRDELLERYALDRAAADQALQLEANDTGDHAERDNQVDNLERFSERDYLRLKAIQAALDRVGNGSYGTCVECGEPIQRERLRATPETPFCL